MTISTPPPETRTRRPRDEDAAPSRRARRRTPPEASEETGRSGTVKSRPAKPGVAKPDGKPGAKPGVAKPGAKSGATKAATPKKTGAAKTRAATTTVRRRPAAPRKPPPKVTPARRSATPPRAPFVLLVVGLLGGALVSLLLLNTVLAQDAFTLSELQRGNQQLSERKQALQEDINRENSPAVLHSKARGLGMVDGRRPAFIDPRTGRVTEGGTRPPGVSDEAMAAAAGAGVTGAPGAIMPPAGATPPRGGRTGGGTR